MSYLEFRSIITSPATLQSLKQRFIIPRGDKPVAFFDNGVCNTSYYYQRVDLTLDQLACLMEDHADPNWPGKKFPNDNGWVVLTEDQMAYVVTYDANTTRDERYQQVLDGKFGEVHQYPQDPVCFGYRSENAVQPYTPGLSCVIGGVKMCRYKPFFFLDPSLEAEFDRISDGPLRPAIALKSEDFPISLAQAQNAFNALHAAIFGLPAPEHLQLCALG